MVVFRKHQRFKAALKITGVPANKIIAAGAVLVVFMIAITPLCGFIFRCGCTWPWLGLDTGCNIYASAALQRCPWCASLTAGALSLGLSAIAGLAAALSPLPFVRSATIIMELPLRIALGIAVFITVALMAGFFSALAQGYALGIYGI